MAPKRSAYLEGLNPQQAAAVRHVSGPVLILAGAGSGKTRVITRRIAYLLDQGMARPEEILAVTFTNKAAGEMRERVAELIGRQAAGGVTIATFHSFCLNVLRRHIDQIGYRRDFTIAGESDARLILRRLTDELGGGEGYSPATFQSAISLRKNSGIAADVPLPVRDKTQEKYAAHLADLYGRYESALRAANSLDFDDLLLLAQRLWRDHPRLLAAARKRFQYVMVDEYQDTNRVQYALLRMLVEEHRNLCVVGDDDQSIYGWRGADARNILEFERDFPDATIITLDQNYRSTQTILEAANGVISNNQARREKRLWSDLGKGRLLDWFVVGDEEAEATEAVKWLQHIRRQSGAEYRDFAVLYRSNIQSRPLELAFRRAGIPYIVYGGQDFFERAEVKDIISYLKTLANPRDEAAFLRIVNMPRRGIGDATLHQAHDLCRGEKIPLGKALAELIRRELAPPAAARGIQELLGVMQQFRRRLKERAAPLHIITADLIAAIDYDKELARLARNREQAEARRQNVEQVIKAIEAYEQQAERPSLTGFLDESHLNSDQDRAGREQRRQEGVSLMTIHSAKGLEFPFVFITGLEDGLLPHERSVKENGLEEERRLFYVALTRGKRHVTLFEACSREKHGKEIMSRPSRFLEEIPKECVKHRPLAVRAMVEERVAPPQPKPKKKAPRRPKL